jgi:cellulose synthase operon protein C
MQRNVRLLLKIIRIPFDLVFVTVDALRAIPDIFTVKKEHPCRFCGSLEYLMNDIRPCRAANKYGSLWIFKTVASCVCPPDADMAEPHCTRFEPYHRPIKHLPLTLLALAVIWTVIGLVAERTLHVSTRVAALRQSLGSAESKRIEAATNRDPTKREKEQAEKKLAEAAALVDAPEALAALLDEVEALDPGAEGLWVHRMRLSRDRGQLEEAARYAEKVLAGENPALDAHLVQAAFLARRGKFAEAMAQLAVLIADEKRSADHLQDAAQLYAKLGELDQAQSCLKEALALDPQHVMSRISQISLLRNTGSVEEAKTLLAELQQSITNDVRVLMQAPEFLVIEGGIEKAIAQHTVLHNRFPSYGPLTLRLAQLYQRQGQPGMAKQLAHEAAEEGDPATRFAGEMLLGQLNLAGSLFTDAALAVERARKRDPTSMDAQVLLAQVRFGQKEYTGAIRLLEPLQDRLGKNEQIRLLLARCYLRNGEESKAIALLEAMMADAPDSQIPVLDLGNLYYEANRYDKARSIYEAYLASHPDKPFVQNNLIITLAESRLDLDRAITLARPLQASEPNNPVYADALGWSLVRSGAFTESEKHLRFAVRGLPRNPEPRYHLATVLAELDKQEQAIAQLELAFNLSSRFKGAEEARNLLNRLKHP